MSPWFRWKRKQQERQEAERQEAAPTPEQSKDLALKIMALIDETVDNYRNQTGENVRPVTIRADLFPLPQLGGQS